MAEEPSPTETSQIDTSPIDALLAIKERQDELHELVERAEATRTKVSEAVFKRVTGDYDRRLEALEAEAKPLRAKARGEHAKLQPIHSRLQGLVEAARLDKEELEFRHEVGEIGDPEFEEKRKAAEELLEKRQKDFQAADDLKQRLVGVMGPEEEPEPPPPPPPPPPPARRNLDTDATPAHTQTFLPGSTARMGAGEPPPEPVPEPEVVHVEETAFIPGNALGDLVSRAPAPPREAVREEGTMVMRFARLSTEGQEPPEEFQLGVRTSIGRTPDNEITIANPAVSRRHAVISFTETEYVIADLKSGNGTFVNEERIDQRPLKDGDRIRIGPALFVFHAPED